MKQLFAIVLTLILVFGLCACGRRPAETVPTTMPTTMPVTTAATMPATTTPLPTVDPTLETNIPDPSVDSSIPDSTDLLPPEGTTDVTDHTTNAEAKVK